MTIILRSEIIKLISVESNEINEFQLFVSYPYMPNLTLDFKLINSVIKVVN